MASVEAAGCEPGTGVDAEADVDADGVASWFVAGVADRPLGPHAAKSAATSNADESIAATRRIRWPRLLLPASDGWVMEFLT